MQTDNRPNDAKFEELTALAAAAMQQAKVPGVSIGLVAGGREYTAGLGVTSVTNPLPVTPETIFQIGSTSKTFTATAMMRLAEQGKIHLDDRVRQYLPDFNVADEQAGEKVTLRMLLTHTCGWLGDYFPECGVGDDALARYIAQMAEVPQKTPVGEIYSYNNAALVVAGRIVEVITSQTYEQAIRAMIFEPLGMSNSFYFPQEVMLRRFAVGHWRDVDNVIVADPWPIMRAGNPAGGVASDAVDQLRYMRFHMGEGIAPGGERLLASESLRLMQTPMAPQGDGSWVGLTWTVEEIGGVRIYSHGGTTNGQESDFWIAPQLGVGLTVLTNLDQGDKVHKPVRDWAYEHFLGVRKELPVPAVLPEDRLAEYSATFLTSTGDFLEICPQDGGILIRHSLKNPPAEGEGSGALPPMQACFFDTDKFLVLDPPFENSRGDFLRKPDGQIGWMRLGGRIQSRA